MNRKCAVCGSVMREEVAALNLIQNSSPKVKLLYRR
jgi:hypothetical protein